MNLVSRFFGIQKLIKPSLIKGELPTSKEAYTTALKLAIPAVIEMVLISLLGIVNTIMVSGLGSYAIAAVGLTSQPRMIFMALLMALNVGVTAVISRRKGEGDQEGANLCLMQSLALTFLFAVILSIVAYFFSGPIMTLVGAQEDTYLPAVEFIQIIGLTLIIPAISSAITAAQRGTGNTKISLVINITANIVNVICCYLLIEGNFGFPRLEVKGAAISTAIGSFVGLIVAIISLIKKDAYLSFFNFGKLRVSLSTLKSISKVGANAVVEQLFLRVGFFLYARIVADLGTFLLAAHLICMQMMTLTFTIGDGLAVASSSLVGQSIGKKRPDLSIIYGKIGQRLAFCASFVMFFVIISLRFAFAGLFTDDFALITVVADILIIMAIIQPTQTTQIVMGGSLRGAGDTKFVALTMLITVAIIRPLFAIILMYPLGLGLAGAWVAILLDQIARLLMLTKRFSNGRWSYIKI